ncbi:protein CANDIDATE G-PROTEIN COUPLED RECEPTOR 7 [Lactuca sativa]|nr:protein CANDIDATE G-PROTEIN COUPLED RECEPTOR 7 [Lactuca sativa]
MTILAKILTVVLLHFFLFIAPSTAEIISLNLRSNNRHKILISEFKFSNDGYISFVISSVTATSTSSRPDPSRFGFILQSPKVRNRFEFQQNTICPLDFKLNTLLFTFQDLSHDPQTSFNKTYTITNPGMNSLFFVNCNYESVVTMDGRVALYNTNDGTTKNYLSGELRQLPFLYIFSAFIYVCFLGFWILVCFKNRRSFHRVHLLMGVLLVMNLVVLISAATDLYYVKFTGTPHGSDVLYHMCKFVRTVLLFTLIVLIGNGYCFWKPFLEVKEKLVLMIVILLQVWVNVYAIFEWKAGPYNNEEDVVDSLSIDFICCFVIFVPIWFSVIWFNKDNHETDGNDVMNRVRLFLFGFAVFAYVFFTRFLMVAFLIPSNHGVQEISLLVLCMVVFYIFRPSDEDCDGKTVEIAAWKSDIPSLCYAVVASV